MFYIYNNNGLLLFYYHNVLLTVSVYIIKANNIIVKYVKNNVYKYFII